MDDISYSAAFDAARYAASQWFRVTDARAEAGRISTAPLEADERGNGERLRDVVGSHNTIRRQARMRVVNEPKEHRVVIECVVTRQRLDTMDARAMQQQSLMDESANRTPIQGDAGANAEQREVWTDIGRDRGMERQILDVARDRLFGGPGRLSTRPAGAEGQTGS